MMDQIQLLSLGVKMRSFRWFSVLVLIMFVSVASAQAGPGPSITLTKTVGTDPNTCGTETSISVEPGTEVFYCYTVTNVGSVTMEFHDLVDSELGVLLDTFALTLSPGDFYSVTAASSIFVDTINTATWEVRQSSAPTVPRASAGDTAEVLVNDPPQSQISLVKTVSTDPNACGGTDTLSVSPGTEVYYCYTVTNDGSTTVRYHTLDDDQLGNLLLNEELFLGPGEFYTVTAASTITADVVNTATWTVANNVQGPQLAAAIDSATVIVIPDTPTATPTRVPGSGNDCDSGYYVLDSFGGRHRVGNPISISGPVYFGEDIARDMERLTCTEITGATHEDLIVLDGFGAAHVVQDPACLIAQEFYFTEDHAVDIIVAADGAGFWVLTDQGEIYRAGSTKDGADPAAVPGTLQSFYGYDMPITGSMRDPNLPDPGGASLRAVALIVIDEDQDSRADGYVVLDSMGGRQYYNPDGSPVTSGSSAGAPVDDPSILLDPDGYVWPFFPGLDIAREMELFSTQQGVVILDGWDGIHPVPVDVESNPVFFANNVVSATDNTPAQAVGLPYVVGGFNDPNTGVDEGDPLVIGIDAASVFTDLEFTVGCPDGMYTMDRFGGVFALGSARPDPNEPVSGFTGSPYFFPFLYAEDMEVFGADESQFGPTPTPVGTKFSLFNWAE